MCLILFAVDFMSKQWVFAHRAELHTFSSNYPYGGKAIFQNFLGIDFDIQFVMNEGSAWGVMSNFPGLLLALRILIIAALLIYALFFNKQKKQRLPFLLIFTGAAANIFDSFYYGAVIDMLHFTFWGYSYPVFNIADTLIFLGVSALCILTIRDKYEHKKRHNSHQLS